MFKTITGKLRAASKKTWIIVAGATGVVALAVTAVIFPSAAISVITNVRGALRSFGSAVAGLFSPADAVLAAEAADAAGGAAEAVTEVANAAFA